MRIGINGRFLVAKRTGVQRAAYNLVASIVRLDRINEYFIFTAASETDNPDWNYDNVHVIPSNVKTGNNLRNYVWEQFYLPKLAKKNKIDILHSPANMAPLFFDGSSIVHIHDLCFVVNPQWYRFSFHTLYNLILPRLALRAHKVITNSNNSKNDLLQYFHVPVENIKLIYWAVDSMFMNSHQSEDLKHKEDYILYVGSLEPRKNIKLLIEAYEMLRNKNPHIKTKLYLIGGESPLFAEVKLRTKKYTNDIYFKGFVSDDELISFYQKAKIVAYPSLYEGFGLPPLEAMACGAPVVTSNRSSIPEVVGDAAIMINPDDPEMLMNSLKNIIEDERLQLKLIKKGAEQVQSFSWDKVAKQVLQVYYEVFENNFKSNKFNKALSFHSWQKINNTLKH